MTTDLAVVVANLAQKIRAGQAAFLMDLDGVPIEQTSSPAGADPETIAAEYAGLLRQARALVTELDWGAAKSYSIRGTTRQLVLVFTPDDLVLGVEAESLGVRGQMRYALEHAVKQIGLP